MWAVVAGGATARAREAALANACARWPMQWLFTGVLPGEARGFGGVPLAALAIHIATVWQVTGYCTDGDGVKHNHAHPRMAFVTDAERRVSTLYMAIASLENTKLLQPEWATEARKRLDHLRVLLHEIGMIFVPRQVEDGKIGDVLPSRFKCKDQSTPLCNNLRWLAIGLGLLTPVISMVLYALKRFPLPLSEPPA